MTETNEPPVASLIEELDRITRGYRDRMDRHAPDDPRIYALRMHFYAGAAHAARLMDAALKAVTDTNAWDRDGVISDMMFRLYQDLITIQAEIFKARAGDWSGVPRTN
jgi:hypothetical protein